MINFTASSSPIHVLSMNLFFGSFAHRSACCGKVRTPLGVGSSVLTYVIIKGGLNGAYFQFCIVPITRLISADIAQWELNRPSVSPRTSLLIDIFPHRWFGWGDFKLWENRIRQRRKLGVKKSMITLRACPRDKAHWIDLVSLQFYYPL